MELKVRRRLGSFHCVVAELKAAPTRWLLAACLAAASLRPGRQLGRPSVSADALSITKYVLKYFVLCTKSYLLTMSSPQCLVFL